MKTAFEKSPRLRHLTGALLITAAACIPLQALATKLISPQVQPISVNQESAISPKIQLAILLDTSNSMDGLIDQTRNQLWQVVNEFSKARKGGMPPTLEVAVFEYGNDTLNASSGYVRKVSGLTDDLDRVSEALFSLTTNGGSEYCGYAIKAASEQLQWSPSDNNIKAIFIAGNEPFTQGPIPYKAAIAIASDTGIAVNTIHAGNYDQGIQTGWRDGALLAGGDYMSIDHNHKVAHIVAPQDQRITKLNTQLNQTYVPYGIQGAAGKKRQQEQDANADRISQGLLASRVKSKASGLYKNSQWDLVDAMEEGKVTLEKLDQTTLPAAMVGMDKNEQQAYIAKQAEERKRIKEEIATLGAARDSHVVQKQRETAESEANTMNTALISSVRKQGKTKNFQFQSE